MADENKVSFSLDLDTVEFVEKGLHAKGVIQSIGDKENLTELLEGLTKTSAILGTVGVAAFSVKKAIDFTLEAESIKKVEAQFETLSEQAGISAEDLKKGLEKSSQGLVDTSDLLEAANKKIIAMGSDAQRLPEIMDLATKASQVFGGTALENFEELSTAIANGNTRMLKHKGILVDSQKALQEYASANNIAVNEISEAGKRQAILNAALEQGKKAFEGVDVDLHSATNTLQLLKVTLKDLSEAFAIVFEKTLGPTVRGFLTTVKEMAVGVKDHFQAAFGEGLEKNTASITIVENKVKELGATLEHLKSIQGTKFDFAPGDTPLKIQSITNALKEAETELANLKKTRKSLTQEEQKGAQVSSELSKKQIAEDKINTQARLQNQTKFQQDLLKTEEKYLKAWEKDIKSLHDVENLITAQKKLREQQHQASIQEIRNSTHLNTEQKMQLLEKEEQSFQKQVQADENNTAQVRKKLLEEYVKTSEDAFDGIGRAFQSHAEQAKDDMKDMGKRGEQVFSSIQSNSVSAFEAMGAAIAQGKDVAESAGQAILKIFLGVIADRAIAEGSLLLLTGIFPPNPLALGAGAGLVALGGALKATAGSIGGGVSVPQTAAASSGAAIQRQETSTKIDLARQQKDYETEANLRRLQLQQEKDAANQNIAQKKDLSDAERAQLIEQNSKLYALKAQQLENDLAEESDDRADRTQRDQDKAEKQAEKEAGLAEKEAQRQQAALDKAAEKDEKVKQKFADAALKSQQDAQDAINERNQQVTDRMLAEASTPCSVAEAQAKVPSQFTQDQQLGETAVASGQRQKVVQVHIAGNYLETDQTRRQLMELIRQESDATGFVYNQIGV